MVPGFTLINQFSTILQLAASFCGVPEVCCDRLTTVLPEEKVFKSFDPNYKIENNKYWSSTAVLTPACIFVPESSSDVSIAIKVLVESSCEFGVRGGGHTTNPGWAGTDSGVLISLSKLTAVEVSGDKKPVAVGTGSRWGEVYTKTGEQNVAVAGGRVSKVGVSGFLLGGGLSFLMFAEGFAADNVLSYEASVPIVLASGQVATITADSNGDLFKALKGGGSNFGIVTSFDLQTHPIKDIYAGFLYYSPEQYDALFPTMEDPSRKVDTATFYTAYSEPVTAPPPAIKPFFDIPNTRSAVKIKTMQEATDESTEGCVDGLRYNMQTYSVRADAGLFKQLFDIWHASAIGFNSTVPGWTSGIIYQPISNSMLRASEKKGGNVLGLKPANDPLMVVSYQFTWERSEDDNEVYAAIDKLVADSTGVARSQGRLERYIYLNYAGSKQQPIESYGPDQVEFLRKVRAKYDPNRVFENLSRGGFKIPS
ncbi:hypothetical protein OPQ81_000456 [Rhizoctonia solani]|nr:hypothetical protein OPQ81_000456 [Rhizoctonia solani]